MYVKQLSVFLENETGRLDDVLSTISDNGINILSISLADTSDFGVLRLLVSDPDRAKTLLKEHGITSKLTDVIAVSVPHSIGSLRRVMNALSSAGIAISYVYGLSLHDDGASIVNMQ